MSTGLDAIEMRIADEIRKAEDTRFLQIVQQTQPGRFYGASRNSPVRGWSTTYLGYTDYQIRCVLEKYFIQILSSEENEILDSTKFVLDCLVIWLRCRYHPQDNPLNEPIQAVRELIEDSEYTLVMIKL